HTGSPVPEKANAVVMVEHTKRIGDKVEVQKAVTRGKNVGDAGEDVESGTLLFQDGKRLRPSDIGLLKSVGVQEVEVYEKPEVAVIPTGEELVQDDPEPGEIIETNGLTVSLYVRRWGGKSIYREVVPDDEELLREALERDTDADLILTTGGSSVGERDLLPGIVDELGEVVVHGVAIKPGHPVGMGFISGTPIIMLPGYPVSCIINAVLFGRSALRKLGSIPETPDPTVECRLERKIPSEVGMRTYTRVSVRKEGDNYIAVPVRTSGAGVLSSVSEADAIVEVPEDHEGYSAGETVEAVYWEY
ncbi:MAG: molybdopterin molybdotransferase MoeA, partial [Halobacteria archaeon]|nr:molybdopterin molybdotransferase MoeA [Halobacteria archaeon]